MKRQPLFLQHSLVIAKGDSVQGDSSNHLLGYVPLFGRPTWKPNLMFCRDQQDKDICDRSSLTAGFVDEWLAVIQTLFLSRSTQTSVRFVLRREHSKTERQLFETPGRRYQISGHGAVPHHWVSLISVIARPGNVGREKTSQPTP